ncbi:MAG: tetratricopeptide repeat protein [Desulfovibrionales bacterium]|nr:tetratricopeptide repeat protein [Desulfovibrionales bacterium]
MKQVIGLILVCGCLCGCGAQALYYGMYYGGYAVEGLAAAAGIAGSISKEKKAEAEDCYRKAQQYAKAGQLAMAEESIKKAIEIWPDHNEYRSFLGGLYNEMAIKKDAPEYFRKSNEAYLSCLKGNEKNSQLLNAIAWSYFMLGENTDEGIKYIQKAMELDGRRSYYVGTYGCLVLQKGNYPEAQSLLKEATEKHKAEGSKRGASINLYYLALAHHKSGDSQQATAYFKEAVELEPVSFYRKRIEAEMRQISLKEEAKK